LDPKGAVKKRQEGRKSFRGRSARRKSALKGGGGGYLKRKMLLEKGKSATSSKGGEGGKSFTSPTTEKKGTRRGVNVLRTVKGVADKDRQRRKNYKRSSYPT